MGTSETTSACLESDLPVHYVRIRAADRLKILIAINHAIKKFNRD